MCVGAGFRVFRNLTSLCGSQGSCSKLNLGCACDVVAVRHCGKKTGALESYNSERLLEHDQTG